MNQNNADKRRYQRLVLIPDGAMPIEAAYAWMDQAKSVRRHIQNLSYRGVGIILQAEDKGCYQQQQQLELTLEFEGVLAKVSATVVYLSDTFMGVQFIALDDTSRRVISAYLDPRYLGHHLKEINSDKLYDSKQRLFLGPNNTSIKLQFADTEKSQLIDLEIRLPGGYIHADQHRQLRTASIDDNFMENIIFDDQPNQELLNATIRLLRYADMDSDLKLNLELRLFEK